MAEGRLWDFIERIAQSRREGKNRRDGATVSTRVLRLTEGIAERLFKEAVGERFEEDQRGAKGKRRRQALRERAHL